MNVNEFRSTVVRSISFVKSMRTCSFKYSLPLSGGSVLSTSRSPPVPLTPAAEPPPLPPHAAASNSAASGKEDCREVRGLFRFI
jgi:hypothetical protein